MYGFNSDFHKLVETETMAMGNEKYLYKRGKRAKRMQ